MFTIIPNDSVENPSPPAPNRNQILKNRQRVTLWRVVKQQLENIKIEKNRPSGDAGLSLWKEVTEWEKRSAFMVFGMVIRELLCL